MSCGRVIFRDFGFFATAQKVVRNCHTSCHMSCHMSAKSDPNWTRFSYGKNSLCKFRLVFICLVSRLPMPIANCMPIANPKVNADYHMKCQIGNIANANLKVNRPLVESVVSKLITRLFWNSYCTHLKKTIELGAGVTESTAGASRLNAGLGIERHIASTHAENNGKHGQFIATSITTQA